MCVNKNKYLIVGVSMFELQDQLELQNQVNFKLKIFS